MVEPQHKRILITSSPCMGSYLLTNCKSTITLAIKRLISDFGIKLNYVRRQT